MMFIIIFLILFSGNVVFQYDSDSGFRDNETKSVSEVDTTRPTITPTYRLEQIRRDMIEQSYEKKDVNLVQSKNYKEILKKWIGLQLTETGYVEYEPCNGINHSIEIKSDTLIINFTLESLGFRIKELGLSSTKYLVRCFDKTDGHKDFIFEQLKEPSNTFIVSWRDKYCEHKWLVTPASNRYNFDFVTDICPDDVLPLTKEFEEIDFEKLKRKK